MFGGREIPLSPGEVPVFGGSGAGGLPCSGFGGRGCPRGSPPLRGHPPPSPPLWAKVAPGKAWGLGEGAGGPQEPQGLLGPQLMRRLLLEFPFINYYGWI